MRLFSLPDGKSVSISSDNDGIWLQLSANQGSLGLKLPTELAKQLASELVYEARQIKKSVAGRDSTTPAT